METQLKPQLIKMLLKQELLVKFQVLEKVLEIMIKVQSDIQNRFHLHKEEFIIQQTKMVCNLRELIKFMIILNPIQTQEHSLQLLLILNLFYLLNLIPEWQDSNSKVDKKSKDQ